MEPILVLLAAAPTIAVKVDACITLFSHYEKGRMDVE